MIDQIALLEKCVRLYGDAPAVVYDGRTQSFAELADRAKRLANALLAEGIRPGDRVATLGDNSFESLEQMVGLAIGGFVRCPLYTHDVADRHQYLLDLVDARAVIVDGKYHEHIAEIAARSTRVSSVLVVGDGAPENHSYEQALAAATTGNPNVEVSEDAPHIIRFSAGTTGAPKGILHTVRGWMDMGTEMALVFGGFDEDDGYIAAGPLSHAAGMISWPLLAVGARTLVMSGFDAGEFLRIVEQEKATTTIVGPTVIQLVTSHPAVRDRDLSSLRVVGYGTAPATEAVLRRGIEVWGNIMYQVYGQSETLPLTILSPLWHRPDGTDDERRWLRSAGRPTPNSDIKIVDDDGHELPIGEVGEIIGYSPGSMDRIWGSVEKTTERIRADGGVRTGDMGWVSEDGFLYLADRKEDTIISGGYNIWPKELENALADHPAVVEAAVVGVAHPKWGETPHATVVLREGQTVAEEELIEWTRDRVGPVKKATGITFVDTLPKSPLGKVLRRVLRDQYRPHGQEERAPGV